MFARPEAARRAVFWVDKRLRLVYSLKTKGIRDMRLAPRLMFFVFTDEAHFCVADRVGYFLLASFVPSTEKARNNVDDKPACAKRQVENFIQTHSSLQFEYSSLAAGRAWGRTAHVADADFSIRYFCIEVKSFGLMYVNRLLAGVNGRFFGLTKGLGVSWRGRRTLLQEFLTKPKFLPQCIFRRQEAFERLPRLFADGPFQCRLVSSP